MAPPAKSTGKIADLSGNRFGAQSGPGRKPGQGPGSAAATAAPEAAAVAKIRSPTKLPKGLEWYGRAAGLVFEIEDDASELSPPKINRMVIAGTVLAGVLLLGAAGFGATAAWNALHPAQDAATAPASSASAADGGPVVAASQAPDDDATPPHGPIPGDTPFLESQMTQARTALKEVVPESHGLKYRGVQTIVSAEDQANVNFCGEVNARSPAGDYIGFQRFISSANGAQVEQMMTPGDFDQAWQARCSGSPGPQIWL